MANQENNQIVFRIRPAGKALIMRASAPTQTEITDFILKTAPQEAQTVIDEHERIKLTCRDSLFVLELLENPPQPNVKLRKTARALPTMC